MLLYNRTNDDRAEKIRKDGFDVNPDDFRRCRGAWFCDDPNAHLASGTELLVVDLSEDELAECSPRDCVDRDGTLGIDWCVPAELASRRLVRDS